MAQRRTVATAADYVRGLSAGVKANCWQLAEAAGHENPYRMQARRRSRAAGIPGSLRHKTKPQLAREQLERLLDVRMPARWIAFDEACTRSSRLREVCEEHGLPYAGIAPRDFRITLPSGKVIKAEQALRDAVFERRSCGNGSKGPRYSDWALIATASPRHFLLI